MIERFRRLGYGHLEIEVTVQDQKAYTPPWTVKRHQRIALDTDLIEFICKTKSPTRTLRAITALSRFSVLILDTDGTVNGRAMSLSNRDLLHTSISFHSSSELICNITTLV